MERGQTPPSVRSGSTHTENVAPINHPCHQLPNAGKAGFVYAISFNHLF